MASKPKVKLKRFRLIRHEDVSGVSGIGVVAEGVEFQNGLVALQFLSPSPHVNVYISMHVCMEVHGHEGRTVVDFIDK